MRKSQRLSASLGARGSPRKCRYPCELERVDHRLGLELAEAVQVHQRVAHLGLSAQVPHRFARPERPVEVRAQRRKIEVLGVIRRTVLPWCRPRQGDGQRGRPLRPRNVLQRTALGSSVTSMAPSTSVRSTSAPLALQRSTTSGAGRRSGFRARRRRAPARRGWWRPGAGRSTSATRGGAPSPPCSRRTAGSPLAGAPASPGRSTERPLGSEVEDEAPVVHRPEPGRVGRRREHTDHRLAQTADISGREPLDAALHRRRPGRRRPADHARCRPGARAARWAPRGAR